MTQKTNQCYVQENLITGESGNKDMVETNERINEQGKDENNSDEKQNGKKEENAEKVTMFMVYVSFCFQLGNQQK